MRPPSPHTMLGLGDQWSERLKEGTWRSETPTVRRSGRAGSWTRAGAPAKNTPPLVGSTFLTCPRTLPPDLNAHLSAPLRLSKGFRPRS